MISLSSRNKVKTMRTRIDGHRQMKIVVIGLDGATFDLIRPWMEEGKLPTFAGLVKSGVSGDLTSVFPPVSPVAWASFLTGKNPGKHGVMDFLVREEGSYQRAYANANHIDGKILPVILSESNKKVGMLYVPFGLYPLRKVNGFLIPGVFSHEAGPTYPLSLKKELKKEIGNYEITMKTYGCCVPKMENDWLRKMIGVTEKIAEVTLYLMRKYPWDFFMTTFFYIDQIQHYFWKYIDPQHPAYNTEEAKTYGNVVLEYYQMIDGIIGLILKEVDKGTTVIIMSDHGHGPLHKHVLINNWLRKMGFLKLRKRPKTRSLKQFLGRQLTRKEITDMLAKSNLSKTLFKIMPHKFLDRKYSRLLAYSRPNLSDVDWRRTKAYSMGFYGKLFVNLIGREPAGIIEPGEEYEKLREYLIKKLYALKDPENGESIVDEVFKKEELYWGPHTDQAADIFFTMKDMTYITHLSTEFGADPNTLTESPHNFQSSTHRMNGVLIVTGPHIKKGITIKNVNIVDIAPTILHIANVSIPSDMDGRVLKEIFDPREDLAKREVKYVKPSRKKAEMKRLSREQEEEIKERLKALGYL